MDIILGSSMRKKELPAHLNQTIQNTDTSNQLTLAQSGIF
jgi:hypothetical protein